MPSSISSNSPACGWGNCCGSVWSTTVSLAWHTLSPHLMTITAAKSTTIEIRPIQGQYPNMVELSSVLALPYVVCLSPLKSWVSIEGLSRLKGRGAFGPWVGGQRWEGRSGFPSSGCTSISCTCSRGKYLPRSGEERRLQLPRSQCRTKCSRQRCREADCSPCCSCSCARRQQTGWKGSRCSTGCPCQATIEMLSCRSESSNKSL